MKLKNFFQIVGFRAQPKRYGYSVTGFDLPEFGRIPYAMWNHPYQTSVTLSIEAVEQYRRFIQAGDFCIDVGAHTGDSTLPIALAAGPSGLTLALEPNPYVFPVLEKNARLNRGKTHIVPMMAAATQQDEVITFEYSDAGFCNGGRHEGMSVWRHGHPFKLPVQGVNLADELRSDFRDVLSKLRFIKIDAEGYDLPVVKSLQPVIETHRPYVKAEVFKRTAASYRSELISFFLDREYAVYKIVSNPCEPGPRITPPDGSKWQHYDILCVPSEAASPEQR
jgi:FkbM family methyltransferase